ncbi:hypothetical protein XELAEV_18034261mg [Xenopus laevis]|uniref:GDNF/GAS1 domain-containing protein n=1 Tax=Xenopus laevis TaxID=8355 RepID=A0A974HAY1_XENLA|nr:hypothetical protein XELAEV_18034261mg [Xenopus laevis]
MFHVTLYLVLPLMDALLAAEVRRLPPVERLDCVKASEQCLKEPECSAKYRTLRQCVAGKESNFSKVIGLEAKDECKNVTEALKQKSLYNCRCKRGMKKEKNCLRIYWSMYQSLQGGSPCPKGTIHTHKIQIIPALLGSFIFDIFYGFFKM